jgi:hypothetical protein
MAINIVDNLNIFAPKSLDNRYLKNGLNPYTSVNDVNETININNRHVGLTVLINDIEYWYKDGINNVNLIIKNSGSTSNVLDNLILTNDPVIYEKYAGDLITFEKLDNGNQVDIIDQDNSIAITRGVNRGIYNPLFESGWDSDISPEGTLWNVDGWDNFETVPVRNYRTFYNVTGTIGENILNLDYVMYVPSSNKYYAIKFLSWTKQNNGGGFKYTRQELNTSFYFNRPDNDDTVIDIIDEALQIARNTNGGWIYNPLVESSSNSNSPSGTLWNNDGWYDLSNLLTREFRPLASTSKNNANLWVRKDSERNIYFMMNNGDKARLRIHWSAKLYFGKDYYD